MKYKVYHRFCQLLVLMLLLHQTKAQCYQWETRYQSYQFCINAEKFELLYGSHQNSFAYGEGTVLIRKDTLFLHFETQNIPTRIKMFSGEPSDSIYLTFRVFDLEAKTPLAGAQVYVKRLRRGGATDSLGQTGFRIVKSELNSEDSITISYVGYPNRRFSLVGMEEYLRIDFNVYLSSKYSFYQPDSFLVLSFKKSNRKKLYWAHSSDPFKRISYKRFQANLRRSGIGEYIGNR